MNIHLHLIISVKIKKKFNYLSKKYDLLMLITLCSI